MTKTESTTDMREQIVEIVAKYLEPHQPKNYRLHIRLKGMRQDGDYWYVVVQPDKEDIRSYDYYGRLAETENDIEENENLKILLVPVLPG